MRLSDATFEPVRKRRVVALPPERAFGLFTRSMATWWPLRTHSIGEDRAADIRFEGRVGGRVVEITSDGSEYEWADVIAWDPPHRFVLAWHPNPEPTAATIVDVRFTALPDGGTQLDLEHRAWEEIGARAAEIRASYVSGWEGVLDQFERGLSDATV